MAELAFATVASYVGTKAMDPVSMKLYEWNRQPTGSARSPSVRDRRTASRQRRSPGCSTSPER
jgi:hypothetical protein